MIRCLSSSPRPTLERITRRVFSPHTCVESWPRRGMLVLHVVADVSDAVCWQHHVVGRGQGGLQRPTAPRCALLPVKRHQERAPRAHFNCPGFCVIWLAYGHSGD